MRVGFHVPVIPTRATIRTNRAKPHMHAANDTGIFEGFGAG